MENKGQKGEVEVKKYAHDDQSGKYYEIIEEKPSDTVFANISFIYLIIANVFFLWQLVDIWVGKFTLAGILGYLDYEQLTEASTLICIYTFIGGALGGIVNEMRTMLSWHCDQKSHKKQYLFKTIISPFLGGTLGIFVYFLMRSGIALFTGEYIPAENTVQQAVPMFTIGALSGYGSRKVFVWLDSQVVRLFKLKSAKESKESKVKVPYLVGMCKEDAERVLTAAKLTLGDVTTTVTKKMDLLGKVLSQDVEPDVWVDPKSSIGINVGSEEDDS